MQVRVLSRSPCDIKELVFQPQRRLQSLHIILVNLLDGIFSPVVMLVFIYDQLGLKWLRE